MDNHDAFILECIHCGSAVRANSKPSRVKLGPVWADVLVCRACEKDAHNDLRIAGGIINQIVDLTLDSHAAAFDEVTRRTNTWMAGGDPK